jgi:hypothetical protein
LKNKCKVMETINEGVFINCKIVHKDFYDMLNII